MSAEIQDARFQAGREAGTRVNERASTPARDLLGWATRWPQATLVVLTLLCLLPFINKAIHIDDPIFIWTAQHITRHPLDPYGFSAIWWSHTSPMWQIQQNPPLAAYYMALIGSVAGWSERTLHLGFILPALVVVLGTYRLALRFTGKALLAAAATLVAPSFLVSATGLMCDVSMLALWMLAVVFWLKGLDEDAHRPSYLAISGLLMGVCALTKYFGISLVPLIFAYSIWRQRKLGSWIGYLIIPVLILGAYEFYTHELYGYGLISQAIQHQSYVRGLETRSGRMLVGLSFAGGCTLPALMFVPLLWSRRQILWGGITSALIGLSFFQGWIDLGGIYAHERWISEQRLSITVQLFFCVACGISIFALAASDFWKKRDAGSLLLLLWICGTMFFAVFVNWDVNARSILPIVPAVAILIARRLDEKQIASGKWRCMVLVAPLVISGAVSLWVAAGDVALANTARTASNYVHEKTRGDPNTVWFEGRWGFEYYMQLFGARALEPEAQGCRFGDLAVLPMYNTSLFVFPLKTTAEQSVDFEVHSWATTMNPDAGAGFYFSGWGPLPFVFGPVPKQRYFMARVVQAK